MNKSAGRNTLPPFEAWCWDALGGRRFHPGIGDLFARFVRAFPGGENADSVRTLRDFAKLSRADKALAIIEAAEYAAACGRNATVPMQPHKWLLRREFDVGKRAPPCRSGMVFIECGAASWRWLAWKIARPLPVAEHDGRLGWWFSRDYPPEAAPPGFRPRRSPE
jgi:hypothetical protein